MLCQLHRLNDLNSGMRNNERKRSVNSHSLF